MNYGETILAELSALRAEVKALREQTTQPFEYAMKQPVPEVKVAKPAAPAKPKQYRHYSKRLRTAVQKRVAEYVSEDSLADTTISYYSGILGRLLQAPKFLERLCELRNRGFHYDAVWAELNEEFPEAPSSAKSLTNYLPVACRYGLAKRENGEYIFIGDTKEQADD